MHMALRLWTSGCLPFLTDRRQFPDGHADPAAPDTLNNGDPAWGSG
jgi:hypothetical protein